MGCRARGGELSVVVTAGVRGAAARDGPLGGEIRGGGVVVIVVVVLSELFVNGRESEREG